MNTKPAHTGPDEEQIRRPSWLSQCIPYLFSAGILIWVFTGLSSNVIDERHTLFEKEWALLEKTGVRLPSIEVKSSDATIVYRRAEEARSTGGKGCRAGDDYEIDHFPEQGQAGIRRCEGSRIPAGGDVLVGYVKKVEISEIRAMIGQADLRVFVPIMVFHMLVFFFAEVWSFGAAYRWFSVPDMTMREMMEVRGAPYVIQIGLAPLAEVLFPLYMRRVKQVPVMETLSSNLWTMFMDLAAIMSVITPAVVYNRYVDTLIPAIGTAWLAGCMIFWALFLGYLVLRRLPLARRFAAGITAPEPDGRTSRLRGALKLFRTFALARGRHILRAYLARLATGLSALLSNYVALTALGVDPPPLLAMIGIPLIVLSIFQPIGVGGYGGPQLIAWFLFVKIGMAGTADQIIAYSLLWSTAFLAGRALIGIFFIRGFWKRCFPGGFRI